MAEDFQLGNVGKQPFSKKLIALLGALAAAVVPATEAVKGWWERELKVTELNHKITQAFIDRALSEKGDLDEQLRVLSILVAIQGNPLADWAREERDRVITDLNERRAQLDAFQQAVKERDKSANDCDAAMKHMREVAGKEDELPKARLQVGNDCSKRNELSAAAEVAGRNALQASSLNPLTPKSGVDPMRSPEVIQLPIMPTTPAIVVSKSAFVRVGQVALPEAAKTALQGLGDVYDAMAAESLLSPEMLAVAIATIAAEAPVGGGPFEERVTQFNTSPNGKPFDLYDNRRDLGNQGSPDGERFRGRGYISLTGRANYERYGSKLGVGLVQSPEEAATPLIAARILASFLSARQVQIRDGLAHGNLQAVRRIVNGGLHGFDRFAEAYQAALGGLKG